MNLPEWVLQYKQKGTEIHVRGNNYYLCAVSSKWNSEKKRPMKITGPYLGKITKEGIIPPKHKRVVEKYKQISVKEYGATFFIQSISEDIISNLRKHFPYEWKEIFVLAVFRFMQVSPLKLVSFYYRNSYLSESMEKVRVSHSFLGRFLKDIGNRRGAMVDFMKEFLVDTEYAIVDLTNIFSYSQGVIAAMLGKNKNDIYLPQVNLILIYSSDKMQPSYFRLVNGSVRDVSTIIKTVYESGVENVILIGDKGIHSDDNVQVLEEYDVDYILPLKRDSNYIDYERLSIDNKKNMDGRFLYNRRNIWFYLTELNKTERVFTYLDMNLKTEEENDLSLRIESLKKKKKLKPEEETNLQKYKDRLYKTHYVNGTLSVRTNLKKSAEDIYKLVKSRVAIEQVFDTLKNTIESDRTYMREDIQLEGWMFVNFIALQLYYKIYAMLLDKEMLNNYSPKDILVYLKRISKLRIGDEWLLAEVPKKSRLVIKKLGIDIPITKNV